MSEILTTDSAAKVLRQLLPAQNRSSVLGLALGLREYEVKAIHTANSHPEECLREVIISFLQQAPESKRNWMFIADALADTLVNHQALAETLRADHCSNTAPNQPAPINPTTLTDGVLSNTSGMLQLLQLHIIIAKIKWAIGMADYECGQCPICSL